jgi:peptidoglycan/LPS O-acetylase OafA/YrhL
MEQQSTVQKYKLDIIETIRGFAALAVCLFHFKESMNGDGPFTKYDTNGSLHYFISITTFGWLGVIAFFVVSGFVIPWSLNKNKYQLKNFFSFFIKRCIRIEPAYLISIALVLILNYITTKTYWYTGSPFSFDWRNVLAHIVYLPQHLGFNWLQPVYWSLQAELQYYILIGLLFPFIWRKQWGLIVFFITALISSLYIDLAVFANMPYFVMGIALCANKCGKINNAAFFLIILSAAIIDINTEHRISVLIVGILTTLVIKYIEYGNSITVFLGKISFSLYLVHSPIGVRIINMGQKFVHNVWHAWLLIFIALVMSLLVAWIFYKLIEHPSKLLSQKMKYKSF